MSEIINLVSQINFDPEGQSSILTLVVKVYFGQILKKTLSLQAKILKFFNLALKANFDLGGLGSFWSKDAYLNKELCLNISFSFWAINV